MRWRGSRRKRFALPVVIITTISSTRIVTSDATIF